MNRPGRWQWGHVTLRSATTSAAILSGDTTENPAAGVQRIREPDRHVRRFLDPEEIARLLEVAHEPWRTFYLLAIHTGLRRGELLGLRWSDLDLGRGLVYVRRSLNRVLDGTRYVMRESSPKSTSSRRTVDLSDAAREALLALPAGDDPEHDYVFRSRTGRPLEPKVVDRAFRRTLDVAGLPRMRFHDLRHTHVGLLIAAGVHPKAIQARLGHSSITTTLNTYGHLMPAAFEGIGARVGALLMANSRQTATGTHERESHQKAETRTGSAFPRSTVRAETA